MAPAEDSALAPPRPLRPHLWSRARLLGVRPRSILMAIVWMFVAAGCLTWTALTWSGHQRALDDALAEARLLARVVDEHFQWTIKGSDLVLRQAVDLVAEDGLQPQFATETRRLRLVEMARLLPQIGSLWFFDSQGKLIYSTSRGRTPPTSFADWDFFQAHSGGEALFVTPATRTRLTDSVYFSVSRRLERKGKFVGVVLAAIDMNYFARFHEGLKLSGNTALELFRTDGRLVVRWPIDEDMVGRDFLYTPFFHYELSQGKPEGALEATAIVDGQPVVTAYRRIADLPLVAVVSIGRDAVLAAWRANTGVGLAFLAVAVGLLLWLLQFGLKALAREEHARVELEEALASRTLLFKEMHHRTKNNLQVVSSLLSLQAGQYGDPTLRHGFTETVNRIRAMAQLHEQLYQSGEFSVVDCGAFLRTISTSLIGDGGSDQRIRLVLDLGRVDLAMDRAVPLALVANEILTNALKHGFPDGRRGSIAIRFGRVGAEIVLTVSDDGVGWPDGVPPTATKSLGMRLIKGLVAQLKGSVAFEPQPAGTATTVRFKA